MNFKEFLDEAIEPFSKRGTKCNQALRAAYGRAFEATGGKGGGWVHTKTGTIQPLVGLIPDSRGNPFGETGNPLGETGGYVLYNQEGEIDDGDEQRKYHVHYDDLTTALKVVDKIVKRNGGTDANADFKAPQRKS